MRKESRVTEPVKVTLRSSDQPSPPKYKATVKGDPLGRSFFPVYVVEFCGMLIHHILERFLDLGHLLVDVVVQRVAKIRHALPDAVKILPTCD